MNNRNKIFAIIFLFVSLSSCRAFLAGSGTNGTVTNLNEANFSYVQKGIIGKSTVTYIFGIGGFKREGLIKDAKENMLNSHPLKNNQAIANMTIDCKNKFILVFYQQVVCTVTADIVEFKQK